MVRVNSCAARSSVIFQLSVIFTYSGTVVIIRSKMFWSRVGDVLICVRKWSLSVSTNGSVVMGMSLSLLQGICVMLKSPDTTILSN